MRYPKPYSLSTLFSLFILSACSINTAIAMNFSFLNHSAFTQLDKNDATSLRVFVRDALDNVEDFKTVSWEGESRVKALVVPTITYTQDESVCRRIKVALKQTKTQRVETYRMDICKDGERWKIMETPVSKLSDEATDSLRQELFSALTNGETGHPVTWALPNAKVKGVIVPLDTSEREGKACRDAAITLLDSLGRSSEGKYTFCISEDGKWKRAKG